MDYLYKSEYLHDLACHKEFNRSYTQASRYRLFTSLLLSGILLVVLHLFDYSFAVYYFLIVALGFVILNLISNPKKGDVQYKRILQGNNGQPIQQQQFFTETGVQCINVGNGNQHSFSYDQFRYVIESENLLILVMQHRTCLVINKSNLEGGSVSELFAFLKAHCPNLKGKKPRKTTLGRIIRILLSGIIIVGTIWALLNLPAFSLMDRIFGRLDNSMSYAQMADALSEVDIHISDRAIRELVEYDNEYLANNGESFYENAPKDQKVADLLYYEGIGIYDEHTKQWYPSQSGIYWQDYEVWYANTIYTDFLTGLSAMDEKLTFTDIREDLSNVDLESGFGMATVTFRWQEQEYTLQAEYFYDWFDTDFIARLAKIINSGDTQLYVCTEEDYGALLYYGTAKQVRKLERITGLEFQNASRRIW